MLAFDWAQVSALKHSNLVEMLDAFDEEFHIHIVMTLCMGGYTNIKCDFLYSIAPLCLRGGCCRSSLSLCRPCVSPCLCVYVSVCVRVRADVLPVCRRGHV